MYKALLNPLNCIFARRRVLLYIIFSFFVYPTFYLYINFCERLQTKTISIMLYSQANIPQNFRTKKNRLRMYYPNKTSTYDLWWVAICKNSVLNVVRHGWQKTLAAMYNCSNCLMERSREKEMKIVK